MFLQINPVNGNIIASYEQTTYEGSTMVPEGLLFGPTSTIYFAVNIGSVGYFMVLPLSTTPTSTTSCVMKCSLSSSYTSSIIYDNPTTPTGFYVSGYDNGGTHQIML